MAMTILKRMDAASVSTLNRHRLFGGARTTQLTGSESDRDTCAPARWSARAAAAGLGAAGLGAAGAVHALWAMGSSWPAGSRDELADLVVGVRPFPSGPMTMGVVALLGLGAVLVVCESRIVAAAEGCLPANAPGTLAAQDGVVAANSQPTLLDRALRLGAFGVSGVLMLRGLGGLVVSALELGNAATIFRYWDLRLYSPLCILLGLLSFLAVRRGPRPRSDREPDLASRVNG